MSSLSPAPHFPPLLSPQLIRFHILNQDRGDFQNLRQQHAKPCGPGPNWLSSTSPFTAHRGCCALDNTHVRICGTRMLCTVSNITHITRAQHLHAFGKWQQLHLLSNRSCLTYQWEVPMEVFTHHGPSSMAAFCNIKALQPSDDALEMNNKMCTTAS